MTELKIGDKLINHRLFRWVKPGTLFTVINILKSGIIVISCDDGYPSRFGIMHSAVSEGGFFKLHTQEKIKNIFQKI